MVYVFPWVLFSPRNGQTIESGDADSDYPPATWVTELTGSRSPLVSLTSSKLKFFDPFFPAPHVLLLAPPNHLPANKCKVFLRRLHPSLHSVPWGIMGVVGFKS